MSPSKFRTIHVIIAGAVAFLIIFFGLYFLVIKKANERLAAVNTQLQAQEAVAARRSTAEAQLVDARRKYDDAVWKYDRYLATKMPPISFQDRAHGMIALWKEQSETLGPMLQSWASKPGVTLNSNISVPAASVNPNSYTSDMIEIPIGQLSVTGDFKSILKHVRSWNNFKRVVKVDPVSLTGQSPNMTATYNLTVYIFPRGTSGPEISMAGAGGGGASAGMPGMPGGMGPGMPPMPGGMGPGGPGMPPGGPGMPPR